MSTRIGGYTVEDATAIHRKVLGISSSQKPLDNAKYRTVHNPQYYVVLLEDLAPATEPQTGYTQADARVMRYLQPPDPNSLDMEESPEGSDTEIKITNRFTSFSASTGDLILVIRNSSEWSPVNAISGSLLKHAIIGECLGGGYYIAQIAANPMWKLPGGQDQLGTGSGTGTYILNSDFKEGCDHCLDIEIDPTFISCGSLNQPPRATIGGGPEFVYCYDARKLALPAEAHVIIAYMGDTVDVYATGDSERGTGTSNHEEKLYMVLTGTYPLIAIPDRFYKCCDGSVILIKCDNYITEGYYCPGDAGDCPVPGTGSGTTGGSP